ncbi:PBP1A family penicillin-binding protein [Lactococcus garvieae]|uniref:Multimodular transpeptidase-transglycosylase n=1 Tax=Lactococcus garvieae DCC43 TaxID=1231377 RepID=K2NYC3_9LACT|nr:PBP1A family penicillin-binding protein [Lactococcus garvieae]EKF52563.1 Multimodular transpeptidase-transglycosylase [Lactococcus garvieae DCC43]
MSEKDQNFSRRAKGKKSTKKNTDKQNIEESNIEEKEIKEAEIPLEDLKGIKKYLRMLAPYTAKIGRFLRPVRRFWKKYNLTKITIIAILVMILATGSYLFYLAKTANVSILQKSIDAQTQIVDKNGDEAGLLYGSKGTTVKFDEISDNIKNAVVATEDRTFYKNHGVNLSRFTLAVVTLGRFGGGSTITQQLAKNAYLTQKQTIDRKAREFFLALEINKHYSKKEILAMYLNNAYFGNGVWGIEDASKKYFGVSASQVTVDEAATLAGMLKGPEIYNPLYQDGKYATARRDTVLQNMVSAGFLKQEEADSYASVNLASQVNDTYVSQSEAYKYPSYFNAVIAEAERKYGLSLQDIMNDGYKIYTTLDQNKQAGMQVTYDNAALFPQAADGTHAQSGSVAINPKTGGVEALVGNVTAEDHNSFLDFNYATQSRRSTGSVIKPLIAYTPAVQAGWAIDKILEDKPTTYEGNWQPQNYSGEYLGTVPMYQALANSYNIPAINTYKEITPEKGNDVGREFGLNLTESNDKNLSTVLGSGVETNPWEMAQAYAAFANEGVMNSAHLITKIVNAAGDTVATAKVTQKRVMTKEVADKMNAMMLGTFTNGSAWNAAPASYAMAGKTGTNNTTDQWVIGYTPDIAIALWIGFPSETNEQQQLQGSSEGQPSVIFRNIASYLLPYTPGTAFTAENAYAMHNIAPITPAWTAMRDQQDAIVYQEQSAQNSTGNMPTTESSSSESSNSNDGFDFQKTVDDAKNATKNIWDKITGFFGG